MTPDYVARLTRLGILLARRGLDAGPVLAAVTAVGAGTLTLGASAAGTRLELVLGYHPGALAALGIGVAPPAPPPGSQLRIRCDGEPRAVAIARTSAIGPRAAVDEVGPAASRDAWFDIVDQLCSVADGQIAGRTAFLTEARGQLAIRYPARDRTGEVVILEAIDQLAGDIGVSTPQRRLWRQVHAQLSRGREISVTTGATGSGVSPYFGIGYPVTDWQIALKFGEGLVLSPTEADQVPAAMGELAGILGSDQLQAIELVLGPHEPPDVVVWADISPTP